MLVWWSLNLFKSQSLTSPLSAKCCHRRFSSMCLGTFFTIKRVFGPSISISSGGVWRTRQTTNNERRLQHRAASQQPAASNCQSAAPPKTDWSRRYKLTVLLPSPFGASVPHDLRTPRPFLMGRTEHAWPQEEFSSTFRSPHTLASK